MMAAAEAKAQYSAILLGATGNVGGRIVQLLIKNPLCKKVVVVTRRKMDAFADPKVSEVVVNMDRLEEEVAPHAQGVDVALAAFGVGKGSAKMPEEEVRKIEIAYPQAFCRAAKAGGARVCGVMTATGADPGSGMKYTKIIGEKEKAVESVKFDFLGVYRPAVILGNSNTPGVLVLRRFQKLQQDSRAAMRGVAHIMHIAPIRIGIENILKFQPLDGVHEFLWLHGLVAPRVLYSTVLAARSHTTVPPRLLFTCLNTS
jgi:uncharacterized protein YbjT (DUF2867 family)